MSTITVDQWKQLFQETGLSEADGMKWHRLFEARYPQAHQEFLEWLGIDADRILKIRELSR